MTANTENQDAANQGATPENELTHDSTGKTSPTDPTPSSTTSSGTTQSGTGAATGTTTGTTPHEVPNEHSSAIPAAQKAGLLDKDDPTKFSAAALAAPDSYVRNFAHAVAAHEASVDFKNDSSKSFTSANEVYDAVKDLERRAAAAGFKFAFKQDANNVTQIEVTASPNKQS